MWTSYLCLKDTKFTNQMSLFYNLVETKEIKLLEKLWHWLTVTDGNYDYDTILYHMSWVMQILWRILFVLFKLWLGLNCGKYQVNPSYFIYYKLLSYTWFITINYPSFDLNLISRCSQDGTNCKKHSGALNLSQSQFLQTYIKPSQVWKIPYYLTLSF